MNRTGPALPEGLEEAEKQLHLLTDMLTRNNDDFSKKQRGKQNIKV